MNRDQALEELKLRLFDKHMLYRSLVVETIMEDLARYFNADAIIWGLTGLLHDIDYEKTLNQPELHGIIGAEILENLAVDGAIAYSVRAHNDLNNIPRKRKMDKALYLSDCVAQYIMNYCSLHELTESEITVEDILGGIKTESGIREKIDELDIKENEFIDLAFRAFRKVSEM